MDIDKYIKNHQRRRSRLWQCGMRRAHCSKGGGRGVLPGADVAAARQGRRAPATAAGGGGGEMRWGVAAAPARPPLPAGGGRGCGEGGGGSFPAAPALQRRHGARCVCVCVCVYLRPVSGGIKARGWKFCIHLQNRFCMDCLPLQLPLQPQPAPRATCLNVDLYV